MSEEFEDVTMTEYTRHDRDMADRLFRENYDALMDIARMRRRRAQLDTMNTVDLLHESYLKLGKGSGYQSVQHFQRTASLAMRHVIVDHARRRISEKRGGAQRDVPLDAVEEMLPGFSETPEQVVLIAELMDQLGKVRERWMHIVDARYFAGMTEEETAYLYGISVRTVRREWAEARKWLAEMLNENATGPVT
ncbi:MAG: ECF-type sigma factor [Pseudomonadota bacterium]